MTRLALRLLRRGGRAGAVRLVLMTGGVAIAVAALLGAWSLMNTLDRGNERAGVSTPSGSTVAGVHGFLAEPSEISSIGVHPLQATVVALPRGVTQARPEWIPPGCAHFPAPGETCESPALRRLLARWPDLAAGLGATGPTETVGEAGLRGPDALVLYVGVAPDKMAHREPAVSWDGDHGGTRPPVPPTTAALEWLLLVGVPAGAFLLVSARLSSATRLRRLRALRLVGLTTRQAGFVAAFEGRIAGFVGAVVALLVHGLVQAPVGRRGLLGVTWFPDDGRVPWGLAVLVVLLATGVAGRMCRAGTVRAGEAPTQRVEHRAASWWRVVPLGVACLGAGGYLVAKRHDPNLGSPSVVVLGVLLGCSVGLFVALRPLVERLAGAVGDRTHRLGVRLAARRLQADSSATVRALTAVVAIVLVATVGACVLRDTQDAATGDVPGAQVSVALDGADAAQRTAVAAIAGVPRYVEVPLRSAAPASASAAPSVDAGTATAVVYATCEDLRVLEPTLESPCVDGRVYRAVPGEGWTSGVRPGTTATLPGLGQVEAPEAALRTPEYSTVLADQLVVTSALRSGVPSDASVTFALPRTDDALVPLQAELARVAPDAQVQPAGDPGLWASYRAQRGLVRSGTALGFALGGLAFLVAALDRARERRRTLALLRAVGTGQPTVRAAQVLELTMPAALVLGLTAVVGMLVGTVWLAAGGLVRGVYWSALAEGLVFTVAGVAACAVVGAVAARARTSVRDLHAD